MKNSFVVLLFAMAALAQQPKTTINLPSSKLLTIPAPGDPQPVGSLPLNFALSPDGRYLAVLEDGYGTVQNGIRQGISVIDLSTNEIREFPDSRLGRRARQTYFLGLAFSADGEHLYASFASISDPVGEKEGSTGNGIAVYRFKDGEVAPERFIPIAPQQLAPGRRLGKVHQYGPKGKAVPYPAGIALVPSAGGDRLLVADNLSDDALLIDPTSGNVLRRFDLSTFSTVPGSYPYAVVVSRNGARAWCSLWNASSVAELDLNAGKVTRIIPLHKPKSATAPGSHPTAMLLDKSGILFVTLSNTDEVAVINTFTGKPVMYLSTRLEGQRFGGSYPNALALVEKSKEPYEVNLFVANAESDAVAVFSVDLQVSDCALVDACKEPYGSHIGVGAKLLGFIPTEWYPTALAVKGDELFIASGKSRSTGPNGPPEKDHPYIATLLHGSVARVKIPAAQQDLAALTREVEESNLMSGRSQQVAFKGGANPIKHVIYIIKENRTYDQVLGDLGVGDGDPSLTLYGGAVTPNQHKLARQFGVLDNFYDSGEVSGNGHVWSNAAISSDFTERTWQIGYRGAERSYDWEGEVSEEFPLQLGQPDLNEPGTGYLWGNLARSSKTYRHYGEFVATRWCDGFQEDQSGATGSPAPEDKQRCPRTLIKKGEALPATLGEPHGSPSPWPWPVPLVAQDIPSKPELRGHFDPRAADFRLDYPDQLRADEFLNEFNAWVAARKQGKNDLMPDFITLRLPNDHTAAARAGFGAPAALVADNDLAVGRVVEAVSHSPYWDDTAIFILEDDAQNGADHVDAHRSIALVASKYAPGSAEQPYIGHQFYTTVNLIHTMEVLIGLPPMNNNDAQAPLMAPMFAGDGSQPPFNADYSNRDNGLLYKMNPAKGEDATASAKMDFSHADAADTATVNRILWRAAKGSTPMPAPRHSVIPERLKSGKDDD